MLSVDSVLRLDVEEAVTSDCELAVLSDEILLWVDCVDELKVDELELGLLYELTDEMELELLVSPSGEKLEPLDSCLQSTHTGSPHDSLQLIPRHLGKLIVQKHTWRMCPRSSHSISHTSVQLQHS